MKESYWGYWLILLGIFVIVIMIFAQDATTTSTQDYYQLKEVANSAVLDSIDYAYYSQTRQVRMIKELFVENFIRRFAETASSTDTFRVDFYDLYESPPKVSVKVATKTGQYVVSGKDSLDTDVTNSIDLIVEFSGDLGKVSCTPDTCSDLYTGCEYYSGAAYKAG